MRRAALVGLGVMFVVVSSAALIYTAFTPAPLVGHPDPHGDGVSAWANGLLAMSAPDLKGAKVVRGGPTSAPTRSSAVKRNGIWLEIPALDIALPLAKGDGSATNIPLWQALVYPGTAWPGQPGNSYIYAHAQWGMFASLLYARVGDAAYVHDYRSGRVLTFHVSRVVGQVRYNDGTWIRYQADRPTLTLQTCMDWNPTGNRYVVQLT